MQPPSRKAVLQARREQGVFLPKKIRDELDLLEEADDLPETGSYFQLLEEEKPADWREKKFPLDSTQRKQTHPIGGRPPAKGQQKGIPRDYPKQLHWEEDTRRKERQQLPWHIRHGQREKNASGQTDAQEEHYKRNAEITKKAAAADKKRKGGYIPWYVKARQEKRARKQEETDK